ncbi:hypothetical protein DFR24_2725 [Panacagrimonas perspica]|uniref:Uncharacterized protein n=1 Tax=Panacagrimonas perspica TaxID=381431 RepID=A0A4S3K008_9GAMM|nr:hypothetical protein [Panacagrimonas perspica]TDU28356.1 hypothetical protein DFR24_2725 [Panacagrimonas perspica]THD01225.1 hypothetical protein B1810_21015 [Panacagrimonas perspica]
MKDVDSDSLSRAQDLFRSLFWMSELKKVNETSDTGWRPLLDTLGGNEESIGYLIGILMLIPVLESKLQTR